MGMLRHWYHRDPGNAYRVNHARMKLVTPPQQEPVNIDDVRLYARVAFISDDPLLRVMLKSAREKVEAYLRRVLITQTWRFTLDWGPAWVELPKQPIQSITSIEVLGLNNTWVTADPNTYYFNEDAGMFSLLPSAMWPVHITPAGFRCTYVAGYGDNPADVPDDIKLSIWNMASFAYDNRGTMDQALDVNKAALRTYRREGAPFRIAKNIEPPELLA